VLAFCPKPYGRIFLALDRDALLCRQRGGGLLGAGRVNAQQGQRCDGDASQGIDHGKTGRQGAGLHQQKSFLFNQTMLNDRRDAAKLRALA
jgi:hypothetical protein